MVVNVVKRIVPIMYASVRIDLPVICAKPKRIVAPAIIVTTVEPVLKPIANQFVNVLMVLWVNFVKFIKIFVRINHAKAANALTIMMDSNANVHLVSLENDAISGPVIICHVIQMHIVLTYPSWALHAEVIVAYVQRVSKETHVHKSNPPVNRIHVKTMHNAFQWLCEMDRHWR